MSSQETRSESRPSKEEANKSFGADLFEEEELGKVYDAQVEKDDT